MATRAALIALLVVGTATASVVTTYQGFDFKWNRRMLDFETPHRIGNIQSVIEPSTAAPGKMVANFTWAPGVNGDWAFPGAYYSQHEEANASVAIQVVTLKWTDGIDPTSKYPFTNVTTVAQVAIPDGNTRLVMSGWELSMACVEGPGLICNGHKSKAGVVEGIWPSTMEIGVAPNGTNNEQVKIVLNRAWTPWHGGGKALSTKMSYVAKVYLRAVPMNLVVREKKLRATSELHKPPAFEQVITGETTATFGLTRFRFDLFETKGMKDLGRYFETLNFGIQPTGVVDGTNTFKAAMTLTAPLTVENSVYSGEIDLLEFNTGVRPTFGYVNGTICADGPYFSCAKHHMVETITDETTF
jgi:hypothetical protein